MGDGRDESENTPEDEDESQLSEDSFDKIGASLSRLTNPFDDPDTFNPFADLEDSIFPFDDSDTFNPFADLEDSIFVYPSDEIDPVAFDPFVNFDSSKFANPMGNIDPKVFDLFSSIDIPGLADTMGNIDPEMFQPTAGIDPEAFRPLGGVDPEAFQPLANLEMSEFEVPIGTVGKIGTQHYQFPESAISSSISGFESSTTKTPKENLGSTSTLSSEIQNFLHQTQAELAYRRTYSALKIAGERIDNKHLLFISSALLTSLPRFLSYEPAIAATIIGNLLAIYQYTREQED